MEDLAAGFEVRFFVALDELVDDFHGGVDGFVGFGVALLYGERVSGNVDDGLEGLYVSVRSFLIDGKFSGNDVWVRAIAVFVEAFGDMLEFGGNVFLDALGCRFVADLNADVHNG